LLPIMAFMSATAFLAAVVTTLSCGAMYKLSAIATPRVCTSYTKLKAPDQRNWDSRIPSTIHALAITAATAYALGVTDVFARRRLDKSGASIMLAQSDLTEAALGMSLGYFTADILVIASHFPAMGGWEMVCHHIAATTSIWTALTSHQGHFYTLTFLATEVTTPFVNLRWCLDTVNKKGSRVYLANGVALFFSWLVGRIMAQLYMFGHLWQHRGEISLLTPAGRALVIGVPPILFSLNMWWFTKICKGVLKLLSGPTKDGVRKQPQKQPQLHQQKGKVHARVSNGSLHWRKVA
jgi:hypothetical protein